MGEVFRARDTRLGREVAIKVLPSTLASDPDRIARFQREAQVLASLNHPHIGAIFGLEEADGIRALVLELVEGEMLAERIARGPVPLDDALPIARQIAEALESAHEQGIIHRDLKPANVTITPTGNVKVLDFGLAKLTEQAATAGSNPSALSMSPTITSPALMTSAGMILGTAAYMSPEQAKGRPADKRSDVWAFGCVLFEMLTGQRAIDGDDVGEVLAAVIKADVSWSHASAVAHPAVQTLLRRCLRKDPRQRLGDGGAVRLELDEILGGASPAAAPGVAVHKRKLSAIGWSALLAAALAVIAAVGYGVWQQETPAEARPPVRLTIPAPSGTELVAGPSAVISHDGTKVAFVASTGGIRQLYVRSLDAFDAHVLPNTARAQSPFFAPDDTSIAFCADNQLKVVSLTNGVVRPVAEVRMVVAYGTWGDSGNIVFTGEDGLMSVRADGSERPILVPNAVRAARVSTPSFLPGGDAILVSSGEPGTASGDDRSIELLTVATGERRVLLQNGTQPQYLPTGHLVFLRRGAVMAVPFDLARMNVSSTPVDVVKEVRTNFAGVGAFSCSANGACLYVPGATVSERTLVRVDRSGVARPLSVQAKNYANPRFSPAGDRILYRLEQNICDIEVFDTTRNSSVKLTTENDNHFAVWGADGQRVAYISNAGKPGGYDGVVQATTGLRERQPLAGVRGLPATAHLSWSSDGTIAYSDGQDIWTVAPGQSEPEKFAASRFAETLPEFSPDGRWLAYSSDESGRLEVYVESFPGPGARVHVSDAGGTAAVWARNGRELFFRRGDQVLVVDVSTSGAFAAGRPRLLFTGAYTRSENRVDFDVAPDGQSFVMLQPTNPTERAAGQINVVLNWLSELQRLVPAK